MDNATTYRRSYERIIELVDPSVADNDVPTCPGWTVKDIVAHLAGFFAAYRSGDPKEAFGPDWGEREVRARRDLSLEQCIDEWTRRLDETQDLFESHLGVVAVADVLAHEQDLRTALGDPGAEDDEGIVPAIEMALSFLEQQASGQELPTIRVVTEDIDRQIGEGEPAATLHTSTFELFRTLHGRRTTDQVAAMNWEGNPGAWTERLFIFGPAEETVES